jgi:hypothetical protein
MRDKSNKWMMKNIGEERNLQDKKLEELFLLLVKITKFDLRV